MKKWLVETDYAFRGGIVSNGDGELFDTEREANTRFNELVDGLDHSKNEGVSLSVLRLDADGEIDCIDCVFSACTELFDNELNKY